MKHWSRKHPSLGDAWGLWCRCPLLGTSLHQHGKQGPGPTVCSLSSSQPLRKWLQQQSGCLWEIGTGSYYTSLLKCAPCLATLKGRLIIQKFGVICLCNFKGVFLCGWEMFSNWSCKSQILWVFILTDLFPFSLEDYEVLAVIWKINPLVLTLVNFILTTFLYVSHCHNVCKMLSYSKHLYRSFSFHNSQISSKSTSWFKCTDRRTLTVEIYYIVTSTVTKAQDFHTSRDLFFPPRYLV